MVYELLKLLPKLKKMAMKKWEFKENRTLNVASVLSIINVLEVVKTNINPSDKRPIISLSLGDPSSFSCFRTTQVAEDAVVDALRSANFNGYAPKGGVLQARRSIVEYLSRNLPYKLSHDDVYATLDAKQGIEVVLSALRSPCANILLPKPGYPAYEALCILNKIEVRHFDLLQEKGWEVDLNGIENLADDNTVAMVIINPGNPCGNILTHDHLQKIAKIARRLEILVIADESYTHMTFGSNSFVPMGTLGSVVPVLTVGSLSKRWLVPRWRIGWIARNDPDGFLKKYGFLDCLKRSLNTNTEVATFIQAAVPQILEKTPDDFFVKIIDILRKDADMCYECLKAISCFTCLQRPQGSLFLMVKLDLLKLEGINDDMDFCSKLAIEESVILLPGFVFGMKNWVRATFAIEPSALQDGLARVKAFCERHATKQ